MLICDGLLSNDDYMRAQRVAGRTARATYGTNYGIDLVPMLKADYLRCRNGLNHLAAQARARRS